MMKDRGDGARRRQDGLGSGAASGNRWSKSIGVGRRQLQGVAHNNFVVSVRTMCHHVLQPRAGRRR